MSNRLYNLPGTIVLYDDESMFGGVTYEIDVNGEDDLVAGTVAFASVRFNVYDASALKEGEGFIWSRRQMGDQVYANIGVFYVQSIEKMRLISTEWTMVNTRDGRAQNGNMKYTIRPIQEAIDYYDEMQMKRLYAEAARRRAEEALAKYDEKHRNRAV
jgi:hypothetical protein